MEIGAIIIEVMETLGGLLPRPFETKYSWANRIRNVNKTQFERSVRHLASRGLIKTIDKNGKKFIQLTKAGQLEALLNRAKMPSKEKWDGKWRLVIFDIPESCKEKRRLFRDLLKSNNFFKLQASVYINPFSLNRAAISYLKEKQLYHFIRILRVDALDNDRDLKKHFNLK